MTEIREVNANIVKELGDIKQQLSEIVRNPVNFDYFSQTHY